MLTDKDRTRIRNNVNRNRSANQKWLVEYKESNPCVDCGVFYPSYVMDFDHLGHKTMNISKMRAYPEERLREEVSKCELVCANCHRIRTHKRGYNSRPRRM